MRECEGKRKEGAVAPACVMGVCELSALTFRRDATFTMPGSLYSTPFNTQLRSNIDQIRMVLNWKPMRVNTRVQPKS